MLIQYLLSLIFFSFTQVTVPTMLICGITIAMLNAIAIVASHADIASHVVDAVGSTDAIAADDAQDGTKSMQIDN